MAQAEGSWRCKDDGLQLLAFGAMDGIRDYTSGSGKGILRNGVTTTRRSMADPEEELADERSRMDSNEGIGSRKPSISTPHAVRP